nr:meiotically up-regulated gene 184 protein [Quercus suber]
MHDLRPAHSRMCNHQSSNTFAILWPSLNRHDYYADLDLPNTCSIDDIKKQYRRLALQYHPDRNAGKEEEYVPKFQAIQTAHEILGDAAQKQKYDADRRKAGLYPQGATSRSNQPTTGNPYTASSAFPPPPRRTQPGTYQRAQPAGADRFAQFPRGAPTARKDGTGTQERANMFRAWQNMNAQTQQEHPRPNHAASPQTPNRRRPAPPPRPQSKMPTEEEIRAGMNYRRPPPPPPPPQPAEAERAETRQSAWQAFQETGPSNPGLNRSNTTKHTRKQGFDPNVPGSDERPASHGYYSTRHKSADFGIPRAASQGAQDEATFPPPPPGPPPRSPMTPTSPTSQRPMGDPLKPFKARVMDDDVPYAEGNRVSTPYTRASGEKTAFSSEGLRRSASVRDTSRMNEQEAAASAAARARSNSPLRRQANNSTTENSQTRKPFVQYNSSEESVDGEEHDSTPSPRGAPPMAAADRPKKTATGRIQRGNGGAGAYASVPEVGTNHDEATGMRQKSGNTMYAIPSLFSPAKLQHRPFDATQWAMKMFGPGLERKAGQRSPSFPCWAIPSSILPHIDKKAPLPDHTPVSPPETDSSTSLLPSTPCFSQIFEAYTVAYTHFCSELQQSYGSVPSNLDRDLFIKLASTAACGQFTGEKRLDTALQRALLTYSSFMSSLHITDVLFPSSFDIPINESTFMPNTSKSRSEESINTNFSPDGFGGKFEGMPEYFPPQLPRRTSASPLLRTASRTAGLRAGTNNGPLSNGQAMPPPPPRRPLGLDEEEDVGPADEPVKFKPEQWKKTFAEPSWAWQPPASGVPSSPSKTGPGSRSSSRKANKSSSKAAAAGTQDDPYVPNNDGSYAVPTGERVPTDCGDAMDIDTPPPTIPAQQPSSNTTAPPEDATRPRQYPVAPSSWHQQQQKEAALQRQASETSAKLAASLADLAHVAPLARNTGNGLQGLDELGSTLPFKSQAATSLPEHADDSQQLRLPPMPKAPEQPTKLTKQNWHMYSQAFGAYIQAYHTFNNTMLHHFATREARIQAMLSGGLGWLEATGDTTDDVGFYSYVRVVRQDEQTREVWNLGYERHCDAVGGFEKVRERVRKLAAAGTLLEQ